MKNKPLFFLIAGLTFLSSACNSEEKMIQKTAYGYLEAMGNYRIKDAEPFASKETVENTLQVVEKFIMPKTDTNYIKKNTPATIEILSVEKNNDTTAVVSYKKTTPLTVQRGTLNLIKRDDKWQAVVLINVPKLLLTESDTIKRDVSKIKNMKLQKGTFNPSEMKRH